MGGGLFPFDVSHLFRRYVQVVREGTGTSHHHISPTPPLSVSSSLVFGEHLGEIFLHSELFALSFSLLLLWLVLVYKNSCLVLFIQRGS